MEFYSSRKESYYEKKNFLCPLNFCSGSQCTHCLWGIFLCEKSGQTLTVLNYGKYIDESVVKQFEKETGITVKYEEYESPEEMYTKYKAGSINYDVICSSEYMVERLINEGEVLEEDYDAMDNYKNLDPTILDMSASYDKNHTYSVPYFYGTLGLLYNKTTIDAKPYQAGTACGILPMRMKSSWKIPSVIRLPLH